MSGEITLRILHTMEEFARTVELQQIIWGMAKQDTVSPYVMNAMSHNGGSVIGAEIDGQMIGFCLGFTAKRGDEISLWSHMAGVHPDYQGRSIGFLLKQKQRSWALENGYTSISWTFDPLQRGNANFNFNHLGVIAQHYHVNLYGEMTDSINLGLASDRLEALWLLNDARVIAFATGETPEKPEDIRAFLASDGGDSAHYDLSQPLTQNVYFIEIPYDIGTLKQQDKTAAINWQLALRGAMLNMLEQGYEVYDFIMRDERCGYVLRKIQS